MIENRLGELRLRIRTDVDDALGLGVAAERFTRAALERSAERLDRRSPGRIYRIRHLPLRWRLDESQLEDGAEIDAVADAMTDTIERTSEPARLDLPGDFDGPVVYDDEVHAWSVCLLARVRGISAWFLDAIDEDDGTEPLRSFVRPELRPVAIATLTRLAAEGTLAEVLAPGPIDLLDALAAALSVDPATSRRPRPLSFVDRGEIGALIETARGWPRLSAPARAIALRAHAAVRLALEFDAEPAVALAEEVASCDPISMSPEDGPAAPPAPRTQPMDERHSSSIEPTTSNWLDPAPPRGAWRLVSTRLGGLFLLLDRLQELDLPESLWKVCLPEGAAIALAMSAMVGPRFADDPAPWLMGGIEPVDDFPEVSGEQLAEVALGTTESLLAALPRRGLAEVPPIELTIEARPGGNLLIASAELSPFAFFAWDAETPRNLREGLKEFLNVWPHDGKISASPLLADLAGGGRIQPRATVAATRVFLPDEPESATAGLLALIAGAPSLLVLARLGDSTSEVDRIVRRAYEHRAEIRLDGERFEIVLKSKRFDIEIRRAGLDRDPGWLPWLRQSVRWTFEASEIEIDPDDHESPEGAAR